MNPLAIRYDVLAKHSFTASASPCSDLGLLFRMLLPTSLSSLILLISKTWRHMTHKIHPWRRRESADRKKQTCPLPNYLYHSCELDYVLYTQDPPMSSAYLGAKMTSEFTPMSITRFSLLTHSLSFAPLRDLFSFFYVSVDLAWVTVVYKHCILI